MKKIILPFFTLLLLSTSCKKEFFDINTSPNSPTESSITPKVLLPRSLHNVASRVGTTFDYTAFWMSYWGHSGTYGPSVEIETYNITTSFQTGQWTGWYDNLFDIVTMEKQAKAQAQPFFEGAAKTLKVIGFMYLVDQYNNVPYSKAFDFVGNITPAYDKGEDIYTDLFAQLDAAAALFTTASTNITADVKAADIMFAGNTTSWKKLVNTLRLKLLIHESQILTGTPTAQLAKMTADGYLGTGLTAAVNPGYAVVDGQQNPFWNTYKVSALGVIDQYNRANNYVLTRFAGADGVLGANDATKAADDDPRYKFVFSAAATPIAGNVYKGVNLGEIVLNNDPYKQANQSQVSGPGLAKSATQSQPLMTSVESLFLQAEATQRGWLTAVTPQVAYENAVKESFTYLGAGDGGAYLALPTSIINPNVGWAAQTDKLKLIITQKHLALIGLDSFESYTDWRRTNYPSDLPLSLNPNRLSNTTPLRLQYPQTEYNYNSANVNAQGAINPQTSAIFWDK